ncbi:MAG: class I SAM-dependent methyltransferase [Nitrosomonas sp.]|nr:class I SAM-dependent methyltransferase [Nitrosomonas sp.]
MKSVRLKKTRWHNLPSTLIALLIQLLTLFLVALFSIIFSSLTLSIIQLAFLQAITAATISYKLHKPKWWIPIHLTFAPALIATSTLSISPIWFLTGFLILILTQGKTFQTQVPLYLSSNEAAQRLASLLPKEKKFSLIDVGCGCGGLLSQLSKTQSKGHFFGIEAAPIPYLLSKVRVMIKTPNCTIRWGDFWKHDLAPYDVVYAYLSPVPMESLWQKARNEMRPGSLFISNSFIIPGIEPEQTLPLNDMTGSTLYLWRI